MSTLHFLPGLSYQTQQKLKEQALQKKKHLKHRTKHDLLLMHSLAHSTHSAKSSKLSDTETTYSSKSSEAGTTGKDSDSIHSTNHPAGEVKSDAASSFEVQPSLHSRPSYGSSRQPSSDIIEKPSLHTRPSYGSSRHSSSDVVSTNSSISTDSRKEAAKKHSLNYDYNADIAEVMKVSKTHYKAQASHTQVSHNAHRNHKLNRIHEDDLSFSKDLNLALHRVETGYSSIVTPAEDDEYVHPDESSVYHLANEYDNMTLEDSATDFDIESPDLELRKVYSNVSSIFSTRTEKQSIPSAASAASIRSVERHHRFPRFHKKKSEVTEGETHKS